jgi:hypothetical protein
MCMCNTPTVRSSRPHRHVRRTPVPFLCSVTAPCARTFGIDENLYSQGLPEGEYLLP